MYTTKRVPTPTGKSATRRFLPRTSARTLAGWLVAVALLSAQMAGAQVVYRWINTEGKPEISHAIPPDVVHKGYEILDGNTMNRLKVVPPQMTDEEYLVKLEEERTAAACQRTLNRIYSRYEKLTDIDHAEVSALQKLDVRVNNAQQDLIRARRELARLESSAASQERQGKTVSKVLLGELTSANSQIATLERELGQRKREREDMQREFELERMMFEANACDVGEPVVTLANQR